MFATALAVALGLDAAAVLLFGRASPETIWALHSAAFLLAAPAADAGTAFFVAVGALAFAERVWGAGFGWLAVVAALVNLAAITGFFAVSGAANSGNGVVAGLAGPVAAWLIWIVAVSISWLRRPCSETVPSGGRAA